MDNYKTIQNHIESAVREIFNFEDIPVTLRDAIHESTLHLAEELERGNHNAQIG